MGILDNRLPLGLHDAATRAEGLALASPIELGLKWPTLWPQPGGARCSTVDKLRPRRTTAFTEGTRLVADADETIQMIIRRAGRCERRRVCWWDKSNPWTHVPEGCCAPADKSAGYAVALAAVEIDIDGAIRSASMRLNAIVI
jgi:hypothetical protein